MVRFFFLAVVATLLPVGADALDCAGTKAEWKEWALVRTQDLFDGKFREPELNQVVDGLKACETELASQPALRVCLDPLARFTKALWWDFQSGHTLGLSIPDREYYSKVPYPDLLELPKELKDPEFMGWVEDEADTAGLDKALAKIDTINAAISEPQEKWLAFIYRSRHLPPPDSSRAMGRFFVYVPGKNFDRYLQFGLRDDAHRPLPNGLSMVSVQKTDPATGKPLAVPQARLKDFWRLRKSTGLELSTRLKEKGTLENCYHCHKSALLPIHPEPSVFDDKRFGKILTRVNELMGSHQDLKYFGLEPADYGPGLGPVKYPGRTDAFLTACAKGSVTDAARLKAIRAAMNCQSCHDGHDRGVLNYPSAVRRQPSTSRSLVEHYVVEYGKMPPGHGSLSETERKALFDCLKEELYGTSASQPGLLKRWLTSESCWNTIP